MKPNSKRILLWLYNCGENFRRDDYSHIAYLVPNLSYEGRRSLLNILRLKKYINVEKFGNKKYISLTSFGQDYVEKNFLFLNKQRQKWRGKWLMIIMISSNGNKSIFKGLRTSLMRIGCISLERGIYMYPGDFDYALENIVKKKFKSSIIILSLENWVFGDERLFIINKFNLINLLNDYSEISKEIDKLLIKTKNKEKLNDRHLKRIFALYSQLFSLFGDDLGFLSYYFSDNYDGLKMLKLVQSLII